MQRLVTAASACGCPTLHDCAWSLEKDSSTEAIHKNRC